MNPLVEIWRSITGDETSWVLFQNGTCVILSQPEADLAAQAMALMKEWGPVVPGTSAGDFSAVELNGVPGWIVTCHHDGILTYVAPEEIGEDDAGDLVVGLVGRAKRDRDAEELEIVHVEDKRFT